MPERETGTVKWFNRERGFGFITRDRGGDVFVHYSGVRGSGRRVLYEGRRVEFEVFEGPRGSRAENVTVLE